MVIALVALGALMLTCYLCVQKRPATSPAPEPQCLEALKEVMVLLQAGDKAEALARAVQIRCEHVRVQALKLVERSRPFPRADQASDWEPLPRLHECNFWDRLTVSLPRSSAN
jgi:hypothetical protein